MNRSTPGPRRKARQGWIPILALVLAVATFFGSLVDIDAFRSRVAGSLCGRLARSADCLPEPVQWLLFAALVAATAVIVESIRRLVARKVEVARASPSRAARARASYLAYLQAELDERRRRELPQARLLPVRYREMPAAVRSRFGAPPATAAAAGAEATGSLLEAFDRLGRRLLILGDPGAGKSTVLHQIEQRLIDEARADDAAPLPVLLSLSSFGQILVRDSRNRSWFSRRPRTRSASEPTTQELDPWIVDSLVRLRIGALSPALAERWVEERNLALLLDGLDETPETLQPAVAATLDASRFFAEYWTTPAVVCCRTLEYERLLEQGIRLSLEAAVCLLPLEQDAVVAYLDGLGESALLAAFERQPQIQALAETPLGMNLLLNAYAELAPSPAADEFSELELRSRLIDAQVTKLFLRERKRLENLGHRTTAFAEDRHVQKALEWIAEHLVVQQASEMPLDRLPSLILAGRAGYGITMASFLTILLLCSVGYALLTLTVVSLGPSTPSTLWGAAEAVLGACVVCLGFFFLGMGFRSAWWLAAFLPLGVFQAALAGIAGLTIWQRIFLWASITGFVGAALEQRARDDRRRMPVVRFALVHLLLFLALEQAGSRLGGLLYLAGSLLPFAWLAWPYRGRKDDLIENWLRPCLVLSLVTGASLWLGSDFPAGVTAFPAEFPKAFAILSLLGLAACAVDRTAAGALVHFATTLSGFLAAGPLGGLLGASAWPLLAEPLRHRPAGLNRFVEGKVLSPLLLKTIELFRGVPRRFSSILAFAVRSGVLDQRGRSFRFWHPVIRDHFALRPYVQQIAAAPAEQRSRFALELLALGELALPLLRELSRDAQTPVARAARATWIDVELAKERDAAPAPAPARRFPVSRRPRPRSADWPSDLHLPPLGREREIADALSALTGPHGPRMVALVAPAGYGKTALLRGLIHELRARELARRDGATAVVCLDGRHRPSLATTLAALATVTGSEELLRCTSQEVSADEKRAALQAWLAQGESLWLILESCEDLLDAAGRFRDAALGRLAEDWSEGSHRARLILVSSLQPRRSDGGPFASRSLGGGLAMGLPPEAAVAWLREIGAPCGVDVAAESDLKRWAEHFRGVPQWLETAVGCLIARRSPEGFDELLRDPELSRRLRAVDAGKAAEPLRRLVRLLWQDLPEDSRLVASWVAALPVPIPHEALAAVLPDTDLAAPLKPLIASRVLQVAVDPAGRRRYLLPAGLARVISRLFPAPADAAVAQRLSLRAAELGRGEDSRLAADLWRCAQISFERLSAGDPPLFAAGLGVALTGRAYALADLGRPAEAIPLLERAFALLAADPGDCTRELARAWLALGYALLTCGRSEDALAAMQEARELTRPRVEAGHTELRVDLARALDGGSACLSKLGRKEEAMAAAVAARDLLETATAAGDDGAAPVLAGCVRNLAILSWPQDREKALLDFAGARQRYETLARGGASVASGLSRALAGEAWALGQLGRHEEALGPAAASTVILERLVAGGDEHRRIELADSCHAQANRLGSLERWKPALTLLERATEIARELFEQGVDSPKSLVDLVFSYALMLHRAGRNEEALEASRRLTDVLERTVDRAREQRLALVRALQLESEVLRRAKKSREAVRVLRSATRILEPVIGKTGPEGAAELADLLGRLGVDWLELKTPSKAISVFEKAVTFLEPLEPPGTGPLTALLAKIRLGLGGALVRARRLREATAKLGEAAGTFRHLIATGSGSEDQLAVCLSLRAHTWFFRGRWRRAAMDQREAERILEAAIAQGRRDLAKELAQLRRLWWGWVLRVVIPRRWTRPAKRSAGA